MRIIGGEFRGRKLTPPSDKRIRPTSDRMRETIFNILEHSTTPLEGANILDVFAGTGAMGIESLSRGAAHATFFDKSPASLKLIKKNIALFNLGEKTTVKATSAPIFPPSHKKYNIIFLDPPYNLDVINDTINSLDKNKYLAEYCLIIAETPSNMPLAFPSFLTVTKEKTYGNSRFSFFKK